MTMQRLLHYAPVVSDVGHGVFACGPHSDYGMLTFLVRGPLLQARACNPLVADCRTRDCVHVL